MALKANKTPARLVEFLDQGRLCPGLIVREQGEKVTLLLPNGREKVVHRDLILLRHFERLQVEPANLAAIVAEMEQERARLAAELDLKLLWEVVREQGRSFSAEELAELFFGKRSVLGTTVVLDALLNDRLYFNRRHLEFLAESTARVERLRVAQERVRLKSESARRTQALLRSVLQNSAGASGAIDPQEAAGLAEQLREYLDNPSTRSNELTTLLSQAAVDLNPAEAAYEVLERLGLKPPRPRFVMVAGLPANFSPEALAEAQSMTAPSHPPADPLFSISVDDEETVEIDDALSCQALPNGGLRVLVHIALVADWVPKGGPMDREAMGRAATVYLPEDTVRMLPSLISCDRASLVAGLPRAVLTTDVHLAADGSLLSYRIYPAALTVTYRLTYHEADRLLADSSGPNESAAAVLRPLAAMAARLREARRRAGATLTARREIKVRVHSDQIELSVIDTNSPSRLMVAEYMVLVNHLAACFASENHVPIIYRTQTPTSGLALMQRPRLSLFPAFHAGIGLPCYAQVSSPIRRYADLVLQRQLLSALAGDGRALYHSDDLLNVLANAESADAEAKELERRAKRYWALRFLQQFPDQLFVALVLREGATAELVDYAIRGTLRGASNLPNQTRVGVRIASLDPLRGWLAFEYAGPAPA